MGWSPVDIINLVLAIIPLIQKIIEWLISQNIKPVEAKEQIVKVAMAAAPKVPEFVIRGVVDVQIKQAEEVPQF